jgi:trimeric autotransporter adhesin
VTLVRAGNGTGSVASNQPGLNCELSPCSAYLLPKSPVRLFATPTGTSAFQGWAGCDSVSGTTCTLTVTASRTVTATFVQSAPATLTVVQVGSGIVASNPPGINCGANNVSPNLCSHVYTAGTKVTLTAAAGINQKFASWQGCDSTTVAICVVTVHVGGKTVTATYVPASQGTPLTVVFVGSGKGSVGSSPQGINCDGSSPCTSNFLSGTKVVLSAAAGINSYFSSWSGCDSATGAICNLTMPAGGKTVSATFFPIPPTISLTVALDGNGAGTVVSLPPASGISCPPTCQANFSSQGSLSIQATAASGSTFTGWTGCAVTPSPAICTVLPSQSQTIRATFTKVGLSVMKVTVSGSGTVASSPVGISCGASASTCSATFPSRTKIVLTASPASGYQVGSWTGCDTSAGATCTITAQSATASVGLTFTKIPTSMLSVSVAGTGAGGVASSPAGILCGSSGTACAFVFAVGTKVTLTAFPAGGSQMGGWSGCDSDSGASCVVAVPSAAKTVAATFVKAPGKLTVTEDGVAIGTVSSNPAGINCGNGPTACSASFSIGTKITLTGVGKVTDLITGYRSSVRTWTGCDSVSKGVCTVTITGAAQSIKATWFSPIRPI